MIAFAGAEILSCRRSENASGGASGVRSERAAETCVGRRLAERHVISDYNLRSRKRTMSAEDRNDERTTQNEVSELDELRTRLADLQAERDEATQANQELHAVLGRMERTAEMAERDAEIAEGQTPRPEIAERVPRRFRTESSSERGGFAVPELEDELARRGELCSDEVRIRDSDDYVT